MQATAKLPYALNTAGQVVSVRDVLNGLMCECSCPGCGARLVAKQGAEQVWHFAHYQAENCKAGYESALHLAVKALLEHDSEMWIPSCYVVRFVGEEAGKRTDGYEYSYLPSRAEFAYQRDVASVRGWGVGAVEANRLIRFDRVVLEQAEGDIRPDLVAYVGERRVFLEVAVTHFIDANKLSRIRDKGVPTLELVVEPGVDPDWETLRRLLKSPAGKYWRHHPMAEKRAHANLLECLAWRLRNRLPIN